MTLPRFDLADHGDYGKKDFKARQHDLHAELLAAQRACRKADVPLVILVSGVEAAGKSAVVNRLSKWLDMRNVRAVSYWHESEDERLRPRDWRFWRDMPGKGEISILFGSWYTHPIIKAATRLKSRHISDYLDAQCVHINRFEKLLHDDGVRFVKFWFHISEDEQKARLKAKKKAGHRITPYEKSLSKIYRRMAETSHHVLDQTDRYHAPWHIIDAGNTWHRDIESGETLLKEMRRAVTDTGDSSVNPVEPFKHAAPKLARVDLNKTLTARQYNEQLDKYQARLAKLHWDAWEERHSTVIVFEGWDAAGKGGAVRRLTGAMDARLFRVIPVAAPTDEEKAHHYLWRFWRQVPHDGYISIYDRSWYGRVLVERVEGFAREHEWQRAYDEINDFELQLTSHGVRVIKFWLHISAEEQLRRFEERKKIEHKKHKLTEEDWRNRDRWSEYEQAVDDMIARTDRTDSPWVVVPANDKLYARINILKAVCKRMEMASS